LRGDDSIVKHWKSLSYGKIAVQEYMTKGIGARNVGSWLQVQLEEDGSMRQTCMETDGELL